MSEFLWALSRLLIWLAVPTLIICSGVVIGRRIERSSNRRKIIWTGTIFCIAGIIGFLLNGINHQFILSDIIYGSNEADEQSQPISEEASELLEQGNKYYEDKDYEKAINTWQKIIDNYSDQVNYWGRAIFNIAYTLEGQGEYQKAIDTYNKIFDSGVNDRLPGRGIMQININFRHRSAMGISVCYKELKDYDNALKYAYWAKKKYPYYSVGCRTCREGAKD